MTFSPERYAAALDGLQRLLDTPTFEPPTEVASSPSGCASAAPFRPVPPVSPPVPNPVTAERGDALLLVYADALDDFERTRIATENRVRSLRQVKGMAGTAEEIRLASTVEALKALEHGIELDLKRALRKHPLGPWVRNTVGVGEKQGARLLAAIGDPYWNHAEDRPRRGPAELWAYCGYHVLHSGHCPSANQRSHAGVDPSAGDHLAPEAHLGRVASSQPSDTGQLESATHDLFAGVAARRRKGHRANWNSAAKMRAYLIAESCMKNRRSPYRLVYEHRRSHTAVTRPGWGAGHSHNDALRVTAKAILRDLFLEAKRLHVEAAS